MPSAPTKPLLLGPGVAPPSRRPLPQVWGGSSQPLLLTLDAMWLLPAATPTSDVVSANYSVLICCTRLFQSGSIFVYFGFLCLQVSSMPNFHPDKRGWRWSLIKALLFSCALGKEEHGKQISLTCVGSSHSVWATLGLPPHSACVLSRSTLFRLNIALHGN